MVMNRGGQFFLLSAVIVTVVVISLGVIGNRALINSEPSSFYDFTYEVSREVGAVIDYEIYNGFSDSANLTEFIILLADDIKEKNPDADFIFIYGDNTEMTLKNYGSSVVSMGNANVPTARASAISRICVGVFCDSINESISSFNNSATQIKLYASDMPEGSNINVSVTGHNFVFPISEYRQVVFIMQKEVGDENFVSIG